MDQCDAYSLSLISSKVIVLASSRRDPRLRLVPEPPVTPHYSSRLPSAMPLSSVATVPKLSPSLCLLVLPSLGFLSKSNINHVNWSQNWWQLVVRLSGRDHDLPSERRGHWGKQC